MIGCSSSRALARATRSVNGSSGSAARTRNIWAGKRCSRLSQTGTAGSEADRVRLAGGGHAETGSPEARGILRRSRVRQGQSQHVVTRDHSILNKREKEAGAVFAVPTQRRPRRSQERPLPRTARDPRRAEWKTWRYGYRSAAGPSRETTSSAIFPWSGASRFTAEIARTSRALEKNPERFTAVHWDTQAKGPLQGGDPDGGLRPQSPARGHLPHAERERCQHHGGPNCYRRETTWSRIGSFSRCPDLEFSGDAPSAGRGASTPSTTRTG